jgi:hypothetical protein
MTFSRNNGSVDSLNVSVRCGVSSQRRQIRPTVDFDSPDFSPIEALDQWVAFFGICSSVATTTSSTLSRPTEGGRPGRFSSTRPSSRFAMKRRRHLVTVSGCTPRSAAT